jgi:hypothetical protein
MTNLQPAARASNRIEIAIGWSLAACCHPIAAWQLLPKPRRWLLAGAYGAAAYVSVLGALMMLW